MKNSKLTLIVVILLVAVVGMLAFYVLRNNSLPVVTKTGSDEEIVRNSGASGGFEKINTAVVGVDNKEVSKGAFEKVESAEIYFQDDRGKSLKLPLAGEELSFMCTSQELDTAQEIDFDQVSRVEVIGPTFLSQKIAQDTPVMILANAVDGVFQAHTVVANAQDCL